MSPSFGGRGGSVAGNPHSQFGSAFFCASTDKNGNMPNVLFFFPLGSMTWGFVLFF